MSRGTKRYTPGDLCFEVLFGFVVIALAIGAAVGIVIWALCGRSA